MNFACLCRAKRMASSVAVSQACSAVTMSTRSGRPARLDGVLDAQIEEGHARETESAGQARAIFDEFRARLDAVDVAGLPGLKNRS
jgi:hypothetical protein